MKTAMILAAGRGERLKPITEVLPKALCVVDGKPLIEHHVINLVKAGFKKIIINHSYLGGQIRQYLGKGERWNIEICYSPEPPGGLETGGGIVHALPLLGSNPFITVNADIYTDFDFSLINLSSIESIHVVLIPKNPNLNHHGDFGITNQNQLINDHKMYTLAGICSYHPKVFKSQKQGRYSVTPLIRHYADQKKVTAFLYNGLWFDIGSLQRLHAANQSVPAFAGQPVSQVNGSAT